MIRAVTPADAGNIARIYNHYVAHTIVTFEESPVDVAEMRHRIEQTLAAGCPWFVAEDESGILGYAYATPWKRRPAYRFTMESTVYLDPPASGRGIGALLYETLFDALVARRTHAVIGVIALPNDASVRLHERFGMTKVAHFPEVGFKFDRWIDVGYWHRTLSSADQGAFGTGAVAP